MSAGVVASTFSVNTTSLCVVTRSKRYPVAPGTAGQVALIVCPSKDTSSEDGGAIRATETGRDHAPKESSPATRTRTWQITARGRPAVSNRAVPETEEGGGTRITTASPPRGVSVTSYPEPGGPLASHVTMTSSASWSYDALTPATRSMITTSLVSVHAPGS